MYFNNSIITSLQAERILALKLDKALVGVKSNVTLTLKQMGDGVTRASYYTSCLMDNYQHVCAKLKQEDIRFIFGLIQLYKDHDVIFEMIRLYIEIHFKNKTEGRVQHILRKLVNAGVYLSTSGMTNRLLIISVAAAVCQSYSFHSLVHGRISQARSLILKGGVTATAISLSAYGLVHEAANCADNLKRFNAFYYQALYERNLEMMYFIIEPLITRSPYLNPILITDDELVDLIVRLTR
ncbi:MAG: hypothetical protein E6X49_09435 [Leclercia adecarboxylata]|nr:hypothetical protein [uncultured Leclercia sp.]MDU4841358.1 hypothetical protein [Leclercia adecarboxylata]